MLSVWLVVTSTFEEDREFEIVLVELWPSSLLDVASRVLLMDGDASVEDESSEISDAIVEAVEAVEDVLSPSTFVVEYSAWDEVDIG